MMAIPFRGGESGTVREEIRSKLHQLALGLKKKKSLKSSSSDIKEKRSRKLIARTLKSLVNLYAFYSSDVISTLLEFVLEVPNPLNMHLDSAQTAFQKWKPVITKFSNKEPELLLHLLNAVLDMIEARQALKDNIGPKHYSISMYEAENSEIEVLSCLFSWLVEILNAQKSVYCDNIDKKLVHRCVGISEPGNSELISSALQLAELIGNNHLQQSLKKLSRIIISKPTPGLNLDFSFESLILDVEQASEKVELLKRRRRLNSKSTRAMNFGSGQWSVVESWKPCPIGMLPGCLPVLDCKTETKETSGLSSVDNEKVKEVSNGKRRASSDGGELNNKRLQVSKRNDNDNDDWSTGRLLINGVLRKVEEEEVKRIQSHIRILAQLGF